MGLLIGPLVALLGVFAFFIVLRGRAKHRSSLYSTRRTMLESRAKERRDRALGLTIPPEPAPGPATRSAATAAPATAAAAPAAAAAEPAWEQSPVPRGPEPPPAPVMPVAPEPVFEPPAAAEPAAEWQATLPVEPPSGPASWDTPGTGAPPAGAAASGDLPETGEPVPDTPAEPRAAEAAAPSWTVTQPGDAPAPLPEPPPPATLPMEPAGAAPAPAPAESGGSGQAWSVVETEGKHGSAQPPAADRAAPPAEGQAGWSVLPHGDQRDDGLLGAEAPKESLATTLLTYAGLVGALVVVLLGVVLMLATSH